MFEFIEKMKGKLKIIGESKSIKQERIMKLCHHLTASGKKVLTAGIRGKEAN